MPFFNAPGGTVPSSLSYTSRLWSGHAVLLLPCSTSPLCPACPPPTHQAVCSRHGLSIGGTMAPMVRVLMVLTAPLSWPIGWVTGGWTGG